MYRFSPLQNVRYLSLCAALFLIILTGCTEGYPPDLRYPSRTDVLVTKVPSEFQSEPYPPGELEQEIVRVSTRKDGATFDPKLVPAEARQELNKTLERIFGTPSEPTVTGLSDSDVPSAIETLRLGPNTLAAGAALFRRNCLHCHGVAGDGHGPTAAWVSPHPRDYRQGTFKFISTTTDDKIVKDRKPRRQDLLRTLTIGVEGTTMPAFGLMEEKELNQLISYVIHLSIRGETEFLALKLYEKNPGEPVKEFQSPDPSKDDPDTLTGYIELTATYLLKKWALCTNTPPIPVRPYPEKKTDEERWSAIRKGHKVFLSQEAACTTCHYDYGRQSLFRFDVWGTLARPANLTVGVYRGGRRPIDIYYRVTGGIQGCAMPANAGFLNPKQPENANDAWDLVDFVQALPYPAMLPPELREKIYQKTEAAKKDEHAHVQP
jgi:mono/diheme cytochrome c family protein